MTMQSIITGGVLADQLSLHADDIPQEGSRFDVKSCMDNIERAYRDIVSECAASACPALHASYDFTVDITQSTYEHEVAWPAYVHTVDRIDAVDSGGKYIQTLWHRDSNDTLWSDPSNTWRVSNSTLYVKQPSHGTLRLWHWRSPGRLAYGTCGGSSTTGTVALGTPTGGALPVFNDAYNGDRIAILYSNGTIVERKITDYNAATGIVTLDTALGTAPTTADSWSIVPFIPDDRARMLVERAAGYFGISPESDRANAEFRLHLTQYIESYTPFERARGVKVRLEEPSFELGGGCTWPGYYRRS